MRFLEKSQEAGLKFDYFISGLTGALLAYIAQGLHPGILSFNLSLLEPVAIALLTASFFFGIKRVEITVALLGHEKNLMQMQEFIDSGATIQLFPGITSGGGLTFKDEDERDSFIRNATPKLWELERGIETHRRKALTAYKLRQVFLYSGFIVLVLDRFIAPYVQRGK